MILAPNHEGMDQGMDCDAKITWKASPRDGAFKRYRITLCLAQDGTKLFRVATLYSKLPTDIKLKNVVGVTNVGTGVMLSLQHDSISEITIKNAPPQQLEEFVLIVKQSLPLHRTPCKNSIPSRYNTSMAGIYNYTGSWGCGMGSWG